MNRLIATSAAVLMAGSAFAQDIYTVTVSDSFEDAAFALESAILDRGLVIDNTSHVGDMLARTGADVGSDVDLFAGADVYSFCSATVSREVMEADISNIAYCPYGVFVYALPDSDQSVIGFRVYPGDSMAPVNALLTEIVTDATAD
ncbi:MAG TPA: DUF302 domain-containing protein [Paracoccaceae bacterium]|nr:DUF302 domain-containing protein [Paracoccaceae bacterium]